jgi:carbonic anhydrase/acetyltransferase-like protein (isoleucine patch superfamily)
MAPPSVWQHARQVLGRAVRETGQAVDRLAVRTAAIATTRHDFFDDPVRYQDHLNRHRHRFPLLAAGQPLVSVGAAFVAPCATLIGSVTVAPGASIWYGAVLRADMGTNVESFRYKTYEDMIAARTALAISQGEGGATEDAGATATEETGSVSKESYSSPQEQQSLQNQLEYDLPEDRFDERLGRHGGGIFLGVNSNVQDGCILTARTRHCIVGQGVTVGHLAQIHSATVGDFCLIGMGSVVQEGAVIESEAFIAAGAVIRSGQLVQAGELWVGNPARKIRDLSAEEREKLHYQSSEYVKVATGQQHVMELGGNLADPDDFDFVIKLQAERISSDDGPSRVVTVDHIHDEPMSTEPIDPDAPRDEAIALERGDKPKQKEQLPQAEEQPESVKIGGR